MHEIDEPRDYVLVAGKCYSADLLHAAIHTATLERISRLVPDGSSARRALRVVRDLKTKQAHEAVMGAALRMVADSGQDISLAEAIQSGGGLPIAAFPASLLDSRNPQQ